ncbi:DUF2971 domain-containing protein [Vreelandella neptunia]|uniref:DUF2971 domain-containing protein n=1 Tax=Vreelandella neptunia TaxID=115551 RepID=UPI00315B0ADC
MLLYKYLSPERLDVLKNKKIRFTQPGDLNDPFEFEPYIHEIVGEKDVKKIVMSKLHQDYVTHNVWAKGMPFDAFVLVNFKSYKEFVLKVRDSGKEVFLNRMFFFFKHFFAVLSLSKIFDNKLMWSHYANSGKGFAIGFDADSDFFRENVKIENSRLVKSGCVDYTSSRPNISMDELELANLLFKKSHDWSYEQEYRFVKIIEPDKNEPEDCYPIKLFSYPVECVKEIYIGPKATPQFTEDVLRALNEGGFDAKVFKMRVSKTEYRLLEERIR